jgi:hypothetical protein
MWREALDVVEHSVQGLGAVFPRALGVRDGGGELCHGRAVEHDLDGQLHVECLAEP